MLFAPETTELSFRHGDDVLVGDLVRPPWPGPYPAVVFVEGSGPGGRDQREWQTRLAAAGFASLAHDKPGSGASTGDWTRQSLVDRADETLAAVAALRARPDIGSGPVALIGHSQGGWVAPLAASRCSPAPRPRRSASSPASPTTTRSRRSPPCVARCWRSSARATCRSRSTPACAPWTGSAPTPRSWCSPTPTTTSGSGACGRPASTNWS
ncbi:alpha/beta hydrolase family protein [Micromonospora sp. NPDC051141]|uniref:alpha/beta hydrolase family protein n=1 Tax=Micromonospora sp. NPDC051141 TaxID=3364284 RepID=UPI00378CFB71